MRTKDAVTPSLAGSDVLVSLIIYMIVYLVVYPVTLYYMIGLVRAGPEAGGGTGSADRRAAATSAGACRGGRGVGSAAGNPIVTEPRP